MDIPVNWEYKNPSLYRKAVEGSPQAFGFYDKALGAFQISCKPVTDHIKNVIKKRNEPIQSSSSGKLFFRNNLYQASHNMFTLLVMLWTTIIFFQLIFLNPIKTK